MEILIVEDHPMMVNSIRMSIESMRLRAVLAVAGSMREVSYRLALKQPPALVVTDLNLPDSEGLSTLALLRQFLPHTPLMVFSALGSRTLERQILKSGADAFVSKSGSPARFTQELRRLLKTAMLATPSPAPGNGHAHPITRLTHRQRMVLVELSSGYSNKDIAARLSIAEETVRSHVGDILLALQVRNRTQATAQYLRWIHEHGQDL